MEITSIGSTWMWAGFVAFVLAMLALDLGVFHRSAHRVTFKEAITWSAVWVVLALLFGAWVWRAHGAELGLQFLTGYVIEKALSVDNLFVIAVIFTYFAVPAQFQHRVLFWGILGALVMRALFIFAGGALLARYHWMIWVFGGLLALTGLKLLLQRNEKFDPARNPVVRLFRKFFPVTDRYHGQSFFVRHSGKVVATPLFLALLAVEATDLIFAIDSIPAIFAVTQDQFIVFTSNIFAILGLRSLYFLLAGVLDRFHLLKVGLALVLIFVGGKMMAMEWVKVPIGASLAIIAAILATAVIASVLRPIPPPEGETSKPQVLSGS
jgi:tellurite resistance protein TerC